MMKKYLIPFIIILSAWEMFPINNSGNKTESRDLKYSVLADSGFNLGHIGVTLNDYGRIQIFDQSGILNIWQFTPLVATCDTCVFNYYLNSNFADTIRFIQDSSFAANTALYGAFDNTYTDPPHVPNVLVKTTIYGWAGSNYALAKFTVINKDSLFMSAMVGTETVAQNNNKIGFDTVQYIDTAQIIDIYNKTHVGIRLLSGTLSSLTSFEYFDGYQKYASYYNWMTHNLLDTVYLSDTFGSVTITSQAPQGIYPGDSVSVFYGIAIGDSLAQVYAGLDTLYLRYTGAYTGMKQNYFIAPVSYKLFQNYPNPFNPSTTISFNIAKQEHVSLKIYNILGEVVQTLVNEVRGPGNYSLRFDAHGLSSGIYFYALNAGNFRDVKKMVIVK